jgi:acetyl esterase/lipase
MAAMTAAPTPRPYGDDPAQVYDVLTPPDGVTHRHHTVVVVHGGFWRASYDRAHAVPEAQAFADAGYDVALVEYRRAGMPGGGVPGTLDDVRAVVTAVAADEAVADRLVLVGHSAGGHLATWAAGQDWVTALPGATVVGVVSLAGVVDLRLADRLGLGDGAARAFVGDPDTRPDAWALADPVTTLPPRVPVRLVSGSADETVPTAVSESYLALARAAGAGEGGHPPVDIEVVDGADHMPLVEPEHPAFARVLAAVAALAPGD